ncbi:MAG: hypothetical protein JWM93_374 [Frankiales bacterium]|nr:hypothetical protein [Frankiales bacterium]
MSEKRARLIAALDESIENLRAAALTQGEDVIWRRTLEVLGWLYRWEEFVRKSTPNYYHRRDASDIGRTLGALIWARGIADHNAAAVRELVMTSGLLIRKYGRWVDTETLVRVDGAWQPVTHSIEVGLWPPADALASQTDKPARGRAVSYANHVQGQTLLPPILAARAYVASVENDAPSP